MAYSNGLITPPVSFADVQTAIGLQSTDLATLCKGSNINMWAKWKPVRKAIIDINSQLNSDKSWKADNNLTDPWWSANNGDYGLTYTYYNIGIGSSDMASALTTLANAIDGQLNGWGYQKPNGGSNAPYRLTDFNYHNTRAPRPATVNGGSGNVTGTVNSDWEYSLQIRQPNPSTPIHARNYLLPTDITQFSLHPGILICRKVNGAYDAMAWTTDFVWIGKGVKDASATDGITGAGPTFNTATFKNGGTYYAIPVLFSFNCAQTTPGQSIIATTPQKVIPYPYTSFTSFTATQVSTSQRMGLPKISNSDILPPVSGFGSWAGRCYLDSSVDTSWYNDRASHAVTVALVNELFTGSWTSGTYQGKLDLTVSVPANTKYEICSYGSWSGANLPAQSLDASHDWYVYFNVNGSETKIALRATIDPTTPT